MTDNNLTEAIGKGKRPRDEMDLEEENLGADKIEADNIEAESIEESTLQPPKCNIDAKAAGFFSNKFFYNGDETFAANPTTAKQRVKKFGDKTVREVLLEAKVERDIDTHFIGMFTSGYDALRSYWREISVSLEERLNGQILTLTDGSGIEIELIKKRYVDLPLFTSAKLGDRENDICVVLGPSGSGKTFFAVMVAAAYNMSDHAEKYFSMVIYFKAELFMKELNADDLKPLGQAIEKSIKRSQIEGCFGAEKDALPTPLLQMHVSVVIDEAGSENDAYFENILNLKRIYDYLKKNIGKSVRLIVGGTGLTAENLNSESDVHKYRMKAWSKAHIETVAGTRFLTLPTYLLSFAYTLPMLHALTSNARAAWFLLDELTKYAKFHKFPKGNIEKELESMLYNHTISLESTIVPQVAAQYIQGNGLKNLNKKSSIRVAAMVFCEVDKSMQEEGPSTPDFSDYTKDPTEVKMANALINVNVDFKDGALKYADETKKSILVSPAITIVLFYLLGVQVGVLSSWKGLEVMTALHAFRKLVIRTFKKNYESLQKVELIFLQARIPETNATITIKTPTFNPYTVWINGDTAPFADVVAPDFLFQCKHTEKDSSQVKCNLYLELRKCGLLLQDDSSNGKVGRVTLYGIMKHWDEISPKVEVTTNAPQRKKSKGESKLCVESKRAVGDDNENNKGNDSMHEQCLIFYPEIKIETASAPKDAGIEFAKYNVDEFDETLRKEHTFSRELNFVVATNAEEIVLSFKKEQENSENKKNKKLSVVKDPDVAIPLPNWEFRVANKDIDKNGILKEADVLNEMEENSGNSENSKNKKKAVVKDADVSSTLTNWELRVTNKDIDKNGILKQADALNEIKKMIRGNVTLRFYLGE